MSNISIDQVGHVIEEQAMVAKQTLSTAVQLTKAGTISDVILEKAKRAFVMETVGVHSDDLVRFNQGYPEDGFSEITFDIDCVVLKRKDFETIKGFYEQLLEKGSEDLVDRA